MSYLLAIAGLVILIVLHETGHFIAGKAVGMRVERFFLFFPPRLVSVRKGETEYGIGAIPLGGFVKITGMNPEENLPPEVAHRAYYRQPVWKRIVVIAAGPAMNIAVAFAILFVLAFGARDVTATVGKIEPGTPAASALRPGDRIVAVDGKRFARSSVSDRLARFARQVGRHQCVGNPTPGCRAATPVNLVVSRGHRELAISLRPFYDSRVGRTRLGFSYGSTPANASPGQAASRAASFMWLVSTKTVGVIARIFSPAQQKQVSGVVGITEATHQAINFGVREALTLLAVISLSLGLINLFPFLPLDGGHIFWSLVEKVRGRPVPFSVMERAGAVGFVLIILLFVIGLSNDIGRITGRGFNVR